MGDRKQSPARRGVLAGVGTVGALAAAATLLPKGPQALADARPAPDAASAAESGYRLTEHVRQYYRTTRV
jgi:hypothetical protein